MKVVLLISLLLPVSCASLNIFFGPSSFEYCGRVDTLEVYRQEYAFISCKSVLNTTEVAYEILWQQGPGPLSETWRVEYMSGAISIDSPYARTTRSHHLIQVQEQEPRSILHELGHAYMNETQTGGRNQHRKMCDDKHWQQLEHDFEVHPYCHLV